MNAQWVHHWYKGELSVLGGKMLSVCAFWDSEQLPCLTEEIHHNQLFYVQHLQTLVHKLTTG